MRPRGPGLWTTPAQPQIRTSVRLESRAWGGATRTCRGPSWRPRSPVVPAVEPHRGRGGRRRRQPGLVAQARAVPAPDLPAPAAGTARAVRRAALPLQLQLPRRREPSRGAGRAGRPAGAGRLALTDHDGMYGVVRFAEAAAELGVAHGLRRGAVAGAHRARRTAWPTRRAATCCCSPATRTATAGSAARSAPPSSRGGRRGARSTTSTRSSPTRPGTCSCSPAAARARCGRRWTRGGRAAAARGAARPGRAVRGGARRGRAHPRALPTDTERNDALAALAADAGLPDGRQHRRALRHAGPVPAGHGAGRGAGPAQPRRRRRLAAARGHRAPALGRGDGGPVRRAATPGRWRGRRRSGAECAFAIDLVAPDLPPFEIPPGRTEAQWLRELTRRGVQAALRQLRREPRGRRHGGAGAGDHRGQELPRLLPDRARHRRVLPPRRASSARAAARRRTPRSATRWASPTSTRWRTALLFERFLSPARDGYPDIDLDIESGRREEVIQYVYGRYGRRLRGAGGERDHATGRGRRCATSPRRSGSRRASRTRGASRSSAGTARATARRQIAGMPEQVVELAEPAARLPPPPRHPLRRHGDLRPPGVRGGAGRVGPDGRTAPSCSGTRTTARRPGWSSSTCSGWACSPRCT